VVAPVVAPSPVEAAKGRGGLVAAVVGLVVLIGVGAAVLATQGRDDDGGEVAAQASTTTTTEPTETTEIVTTLTAVAPGYDTIEAGFLDQCVSDQLAEGELDQAGAQGFCQCSFESIRSTIDFDRFVELDDEARSTGRQPDEIADAVAPCVDRF
jgi:hypothetical protein